MNEKVDNIEQNIEVGAIYRHVDGLTYQIDSIGEIHTTIGYEDGDRPQELILYTQLEAGNFPIGKKWVKDIEGFKKYFKKID